jgi:hypothetical protein
MPEPFDRENEIAKAQIKAEADLRVEEFKAARAHQLEEYKAARADKLEEYKGKLSSQLAHHQASEGRYLTSLKATLEFGSGVCKSALFLNGASAIALLSFVGSQRNSAGLFIHGYLLVSLACFAAGAVFAAITQGLSYVSQAFYTRDFEQRRASPIGKMHYAALLTAVVSVLAFLCGLGFAYCALRASSTLT